MNVDLPGDAGRASIHGVQPGITATALENRSDRQRHGRHHTDRGKDKGRNSTGVLLIGRESAAEPFLAIFGEDVLVILVVYHSVTVVGITRAGKSCSEKHCP